MHFLSLLLAALLAAAGPAQAFDASRFPSPTLNAPKVDRLEIQGLGSTGDVSAMSAKPTGAGALSRRLEEKLADAVSPEDFRSVADADDSMSFVRAITAKRIVQCSAGKEYVVGGIDLTNSQVVDCRNAVLRAKAGSAYMFRLLDYAPELRNAYIADASGAATAIVIGSSYNARLRNATIINAQNPIALLNSAGQSSTQVSRPVIENVLADTYSGTGLSYGPNVAELNATRVYLDAGAVASVTTGKLKPKPGTYGVRGISTGTTLAPGGHLFTAVTTINAAKGWSFTDAQYVKIVSSIADSHSDYGIEVLGASKAVDATGLFVGTTRGVYVGGSSSSISFSHLNTTLTGYTPPWGSTDFWAAAGPYWDLTVDGTARVQVDAASWAGSKAISVASGAALALPGAERFGFQTTTAPAAGSTTYLGQHGASSTVGVGWVAPYGGVITDAILITEDAPGAGQTYTYKVLVNSVVVATLRTSAGASDYGGHPRGLTIPVNEGDLITLSVALSSGAYATKHRGFVRLLPVM